MASTNISLRLALRLPNTSASDSSPPGEMPKMNRPSSRWSSMAMLAAVAAGCAFGMLMVPVPSLMRLVASTSVAMNVMHEVMFSALSVTCSPT